MFFVDNLDTIIDNLSRGNGEINNFLEQLVFQGLAGALAAMNIQKLTGSRILELFELCGESLQRFHYHCCVELPCQQSGQLVTILEPYISIMGLTEPERLRHHFEARQYGRSMSFWALKDPPFEKDYQYPSQTPPPQAVA